MSDVKWIKVTTDVFDDEKILLIESLPEADSIIVIWFKLLCLAGKMNNSGVFMMNDQIAYTDKMLATIFRRKESTVQLALQTFEQFGMVEIVEGVITIPNWSKHQSLEQLEARKEYQRQYHREYRKKQKMLALGNSEDKHLRKCLRNDDVNSTDKNKNKIRKEEDNIYNVQNAEAEALFEELWQQYPNKKGKGQVSLTAKKKLLKVGAEEMQRALERYKTDLAKDSDWRKTQNGSTFFNTGYVDYLDENYHPASSSDGFYEMAANWAEL